MRLHGFRTQCFRSAMRLRIAFIAEMSLVDGTRQANDEGIKTNHPPLRPGYSESLREQAAWQANDE
jgi:hypothetical protein